VAASATFVFLFVFCFVFLLSQHLRKDIFCLLHASNLLCQHHQHQLSWHHAAVWQLDQPLPSVVPPARPVCARTTRRGVRGAISSGEIYTCAAAVVVGPPTTTGHGMAAAAAAAMPWCTTTRASCTDRLLTPPHPTLRRPRCPPLQRRPQRGLLPARPAPPLRTQPPPPPPPPPPRAPAPLRSTAGHRARVS
jgi:hypothetical protein